MVGASACSLDRAHWLHRYSRFWLCCRLARGVQLSRRRLRNLCRFCHGGCNGAAKCCVSSFAASRTTSIREAAAWNREYGTRLDGTCICTGTSTVDEVWGAHAGREKERFVASDEMRLDHTQWFYLREHNFWRAMIWMTQLAIMSVPLQKLLLGL